MNFPEDYPYSPPQFRFTPSIFHPNVYKDGRLCISILHRSGDTTSGEPDGETWSPVQTVESVLISIISLLSDPNLSSPANVDASVVYKKSPEEFKKRVEEEVSNSKKNIPPGFVMPTSKAAYVAPTRQDKEEDGIEDDFWYESEDSDDADGDDGSFGSDFENDDDEQDEDDASDEEQDEGMYKNSVHN